MTQKDKELLLKDLCARLPYETRVRYTYAFAGAVGINKYSDEGTLYYDKLQDFSLPNVGYERRRVVYILPYLRPMSSMTEEEKEEYQAFFNYDGVEYPEEYIDWLNAHHFDYRGLIEKGLALEAPEGMYSI
jgi:hypothetical protein